MSFWKDYEPQFYRQLVQNEAKISELTKELIKQNLWLLSSSFVKLKYCCKWKIYIDKTQELKKLTMDEVLSRNDRSVIQFGSLGLQVNWIS